MINSDLPISKSPRRILLVGLGSIGTRHHRVLSKVFPLATIDIVSAHSKPEARAFSHLESVSDFECYDYFVICSPTSRHRADLELINSKVEGKPVLVEKPLFDQLTQVSSPNRIFVGYNLRFHPTLRALKAHLAGLRVFDVQVRTGQYLPFWRPQVDYRQSYSASKSAGGGVLLDLSHELDYIQWLVGEVTCLAGLAQKISDLEIDSDDYACFFGKTQTGCVVNITLDYLSCPTVRQVRVNTEKGSILADLVAGTIVLGDRLGEVSKESIGSNDRDETYAKMHLSIFSEDPSELCNLESAVSVLRLVDSIRSADRRLEL